MTAPVDVAGYPGWLPTLGRAERVTLGLALSNWLGCTTARAARLRLFGWHYSTPDEGRGLIVLAMLLDLTPDLRQQLNGEG